MEFIPVSGLCQGSGPESEAVVAARFGSCCVVRSQRDSGFERFQGRFDCSKQTHSNNNSLDNGSRVKIQILFGFRISRDI